MSLNLMRFATLLFSLLSVLLVAACGGPAWRSGSSSETVQNESRPFSAKGNEVVFFAMGLIGTGYRFGGKNPEAGLDCSGMVSYIYSHAASLKIEGSAADIARLGRAIDRAEMRPGDLVFFNTQNRSFSHVGIFIGDARFIHAPSTNGRVRIDRLSDAYYATRFEAARTFFE